MLVRKFDIQGTIVPSSYFLFSLCTKGQRGKGAKGQAAWGFTLGADLAGIDFATYCLT